jgi:cytochrome c-type biogenesis protein CcmH
MLNRKSLYGILGLAAIAVLGTAVGLYVMISSRTDPGAAVVASPAGGMSPAMPANSTAPAAAPSIEVAAERLAQRLKANDGTGDEWALLARSYVQMKRYPEAVDAYAKALQKTPGDQALLNEQAAARAATGGGAPPK